MKKNQGGKVWCGRSAEGKRGKRKNEGIRVSGGKRNCGN